jgi:hypothetical protein
MLAHELAHVVRRDPAWQLLAAAIESALWFQPLHRLARRGMQEAAEELSDDWAVRHTGSGVHLARCLAEVAAWPDPEASSLASPMAAGGKLLVRRVQRLLDERERERGLWARRWRGLLGAGLLAAVGLAAPGVSFASNEPTVAPVVVPDVPDVPPVPVLAHVPDDLRLAYAGAGELPMFALAHGDHDHHDHHVVVVEKPQELTARQRRLLRRAARLDRRAEKLRDKSGVREGLPVAWEVDGDHVIEIHTPRDHHVRHPHARPVVFMTPPVPPTPPTPPTPPPHVRVIHPHVPAPPTPPAPPRHVRVFHPVVDHEAIEAAAEAAEEAAEAAAEAAEEAAEAAQAELERALSADQIRHLEAQARALAQQAGALGNLDAEIKREVDRAMRDVARELRQAKRELERARSRGRDHDDDDHCDHDEEAARAAEALREIGEDAEDEDFEDVVDHEALRKLIEDARRNGHQVRVIDKKGKVRVIDKDELRRVKDIAKAAKAREKARRELEKHKHKHK